jgi:hypothetical protein
MSAQRNEPVSPWGLTRIRRHFVVYFCLHRGKFAGKHGKLARSLFHSEADLCTNFERARLTRWRHKTGGGRGRLRNHGSEQRILFSAGHTRAWGL